MGKVTFEGWLRLVDVWLVALVGLDSGSLEEWYWMEWYQRDKLPMDAAYAYCLSNGIVPREV